MGRVRYLFKTVSVAASWLHTSARILCPMAAKEFYRRPLPRHCVSFSSPEGRLIFQEALAAGHMEAYFTLAGQLCTQDEPSYCGLTTLVMVLNALEMDPGRVWKGPWRWYHESMFTDCLPPDVLTKGIVMDKFAELARCSGLHVDLQRVGPDQDIEDFRGLVSHMTANVDCGILISCYDRRAIGQTGTGHFAPIGGYHAQRELVFLFDTARFKYPPHWVPLGLLWDGMGRVDDDIGRPRGYMLITRSSKRTSCLHVSSPRTKVSGRSPDQPGLVLFGLSDIAQQAFLSPLSLRDSRSLGRRLRHVFENWVTWLDQPAVESASDSALLDASRVVSMAVDRLLSACVSHQPGAFFLTLQPPNLCSCRAPKSSDPATTSRKHQHDLSQDLLTSPLGQAVRSKVFGASMDPDSFSWLTGETGPFHMPFVSGQFSSSPASTDDCPVNALADAALRLSLFLTCFLSVFPYQQAFRGTGAGQKVGNCPATSTEVTATNRQVLARVAGDSAKALSPATFREISSLQISFSGLLSTPLDISKPCCAGLDNSNTIGVNCKDKV